MPLSNATATSLHFQSVSRAFLLHVLLHYKGCCTVLLNNKPKTENRIEISSTRLVSVWLTFLVVSLVKVYSLPNVVIVLWCIVLRVNSRPSIFCQEPLSLFVSLWIPLSSYVLNPFTKGLFTCNVFNPCPLFTYQLKFSIVPMVTVGIVYCHHFRNAKQ